MRVRFRRRDLAISGISAVVLLVTWEVAADLVLGPAKVLASPSQIIVSLVTEPQLYLSALLSTAWVALRGWIIGNAVALLLALAFVRFAVVENLLLRTALTLFCLPYVAILPILSVTFPGDVARVALASLAVFFTTLVTAILGLRTAERGSLTMVRAWGGGPGAMLRHVQLRSALPSIFAGLQVGAASAVLGAIFAEFIGADQGLGVLLVNGLASLAVARIWSIAVLATLLGAVPFALLRAAGRRLGRWSPALDSSSAPPIGGPRRLVTAPFWILGSIAVTVLAWYGFLAAFQVSPFVGKTPLDVLGYLVTGPGAAEQRGAILAALGITLIHAGAGYVAGLVVGTMVAIAFLTAPVLERVLTPLMVSLQSVPIIVLTPLLIVLFGRGLLAVAVITTIVTFFPTLANVSTSLRRAPGDSLLLLRSYGGSLADRLLRVQLPYALPGLFASARIAAPASVLAATVAEWLATGDGIGHVIIVAQAQSSFTQLWAAATVLVATSLIFYGLVGSAERRILARVGMASG